MYSTQVDVQNYRKKMKEKVVKQRNQQSNYRVT